MKINGNLKKTMNIDRKRWKSSDDKKPAWNRAKVSIGPASRFLSLRKSLRHPHLEIHENLSKSMEILEHTGMVWNPMKVVRGQEASLESSKGFYKGSKSNLTDVTPMLRNPWKSTKIYEMRWKSSEDKRWKSSEDKKPAWNRAKASIGAASPIIPF